MAIVLKVARRSRSNSALAAILLAGLALSGEARAQQPQSDCLIKQAADAAVQRQITLIDAAKVNPSEFFNGSDSCVAVNLLKRFDLSSLIPDLSGFLTSQAQNLIQQAIDAAKNQVCRILDKQFEKVIDSINQKMASFQSSITRDLFGALNGSVSPVMMPNIPDLGRYKFEPNNSTGSALDLTNAPQLQQPVPQPAQTTQPTLQPSAPAGASEPAASPYRGIYQ
ncbi:hypothetical protein [Methylobacterium sp. 22177]|uniref:hypothetical protein n=1 Tax=Methylobacterium sp. 22177 TaxID=3453885 RepID=UPI003F87EF11